MKTVLFFRHGKSDWEAEYDHDAQRPLKKRGRKAARRMGRFLASAEQVPEQVLTSPAVRARTTALIAAEEGKWEVPIREVPELYHASPEHVLAVIRAEDDTVDALMLVGHEPSFTAAVARLIGQAQVSLPTAAMARVDIDVETWAAVDFGKGVLVWLVPPRLLEKRRDED